MHALSKLVSSNPLLRSMEHLLPRGTYLVGGCIRDMLLGREPLDFDIVTFAPMDTIARDIAARLGSKPFWMDEKRGVLRIAMRESGGSFDISLPKGTDIEEDLVSRDITINAMAYEPATDTFIDPVSGTADLDSGIIRMISEENLLSDPLRALRAARFSVTLDFALQEDTVRMIRKHGSLLRRVSPERIRQEIVHALESFHASKFFRLLTWTDLLPEVFPSTLTGEVDPRRLWHPVFNTALPISMEMDGLLFAADALMPGCIDELRQETERGVSRMSLLKLASFLLGLREAQTGKVADEETIGAAGEELFAEKAAGYCISLHFSSLSSRMMRNLLGTLSRTTAFLSCPSHSALDLHRFCEEAGSYLPERLLLSLAWTQVRDLVRRQAASEVWEYYSGVYVDHKKNPLLTGRDILQTLKAAPGPMVGQYLHKIEEARAQGMIKTRDDALTYLLDISS